MSSILINIKSKYPQMNEAMKKIADYILNASEDITFEKASDFAEKSDVSAASVSRFVKLLGYKNFYEFKINLASTKNVDTKIEVETLAYNGMKPGNTTTEICQTIFSRSIRVIEETMKILNISIMEEIASEIDNANRIFVIGVGRSKVTTKALVSRLYRIGYNISEYCDSHEIVNITTIIGENDLIIACSNFGKSKCIVEGVRRAKSNGAKSVCITSLIDSPLAKAADLVILSSYDYDCDKMGQLFEPSSENIAQLILVDCLYMLVAMKHEKDNLNRYKAFSREIISEHV